MTEGVDTPRNMTIMEQTWLSKLKINVDIREPSSGGFDLIENDEYAFCSFVENGTKLLSTRTYSAPYDRRQKSTLD